MNIRFGSLCSGIEAASMAWEPLVPVMRWIGKQSI